ncbi:kinesin light chain [Ceratobasidium sp. AG-Ba]|nr:kinesin light chain [Ceratobasidium sp. AG-Ba]
MSDRREVAQGVNILIIEGGGARGLSSLIILDEIMKRIQNVKGLSKLPAVQDHFDFIAGTGTGAVIACMVGRLGMTTNEAIEQYTQLAAVFSERKWMSTTAYKLTTLKNVLKGIVKTATGDENTTMLDDRQDSNTCKTVVFAMSSENINASIPCVFRSYQNSINQMPDCAIWEVLSATMAHPEMFKPVEIELEHLQQSFIGGGIACNNPAKHVLEEVKAAMPDRDISSVVCIGAGHPETIRLKTWNVASAMRLVPTSVLNLTRQIAFDAERVAEEMEKLFRSVPGVYFRFSVDQGLQAVGAAEWEKRNQVVANTRAYMQGARVSRSVSQSVVAVTERKTAVNNKEIVPVVEDGEIQPRNTSHAAGYKACPAPTPDFTGRRDTIEQIVACISGGNTQRCVFVLYGLGGSGKTQLALKTVQQTWDNWTDVVFVDATTHETAMATLAGFANEKNIGNSHDSALKWLGNQRERWLMIVDNADDPDVDIRRYFPTGDHGSILVTTRIKQHAALARGDDSDRQVASMKQDEAMGLLLKAAKLKETSLPAAERQAATRLLEDVGYLALAVVQAGAYIFSAECTIADYYDMFLQHRKNALEQSTRLPVKTNDYKHSVYTTWHMSYKKLGKSAQQLLHFTAFMHHTNITEDIFRRAAANLEKYEPAIPATQSEQEIRAYVSEFLGRFLSTGAWNSSAFRETMTELQSYSLINYDKVNREYTLHVLVHDWASTVIEHPQGVAIDHTALLLAVSIDFDDTIDSLEYKLVVETHLNNLLRRQQIPRANNTARFGEVYYRSSNWKQKERMDRITVDGRKELLGEEDPSTLSSMNNLALTYQNQGKYREAAALQEQLVEIRKRVSGHDHRHTLTAMSNLAGTYYELGRYTDAQSLQLHILDTRKRVYGREDPDTLISMHELAVTYKAQSRYDEAQALLVQVVDAKKRVKGDEHPSTLTSMGELASTYYHQGRYDEAESMQVHVLEVRKRRQGDEHPDTLSTMGNLAATYYAKGRYGEAEELEVKVLGARKRAYGEDHPETLASMHNLARTYHDQGRYDLAGELGKKVVDGEEIVLGARHPSRLVSMRGLLATYKAMGERRSQEYTILADQIAELEKSVT